MESSVLEPAVLDGFARLGRETGRDLLGRAIESFRRDAAKATAAFERARADDDRKAIADAAHQLAGSSGALGGRRLAELCQELERPAATMAAATAVRERIEDELGRFLAALDDYRAASADPF